MGTLTGWTIVFDLDGTLVDTAPDLVAALNHCLTDAGYDAAPEGHGRKFIGGGAKAMIRAGAEWQGLTLNEEEVQALWDVFIPYYQDHIADHSQPFPHVLEALDALAAQGATLAICTNKIQSLTDELIAKLGIGHRFAAIIGSDSVPSKKPDGDHIRRTVLAAGGSPDRSIMLGDSTTDAGAAKDLGVPLIFVDFGYGPAPDLSEANVYSLSDYSGLVSQVNVIVGQSA